MYKQISKEPGGKAAALAYLGDDGIKMMKYDQFIQGGKIQPEIAYQLSFGEVLDTSRKSSDKDVQTQIQKVVEKAEPGFFGKMFGAIPMTEQSKRVLTTAVSQNYDKLAGNLAMDDENAMKVALNVAKGELDVVGPYAYERGTDRKPVYQMIGSDEVTAGKVFSEFLNKRARENGITSPLPSGSEDRTDVGRGYVDFFTAGALPAASRRLQRAFGTEPNVIVMRLPDQGNDGVFAVTIVDPDGTTKSFPMSTGEIRDFYEKDKRFK
jgi:hypothetical protein